MAANSDWAYADAGLGLCLTCLSEYKAQFAAEPNKARMRTPKFAVTLAPTIVPIGPAGVGIVAVPCCYDHIPGAPSGRKPLLVANSGLS
jgi:hypothetical protein